MKKIKPPSHPPVQRASQEKKTELDGYPIYPVSEDIYKQGEREEFVEDANDTSVYAYSEDDAFRSHQEQEFDEEVFGGDLDVPGSELDDQQESVGSEDEENNLYSLGDDNTNELDELQGE